MQLLTALVVGLVLMLQTDPLFSVKSKLREIRTDAQAALDRNATLRPNAKLPKWATDTFLRIRGVAESALIDAEQIKISPTSIKPPTCSQEHIDLAEAFAAANGLTVDLSDCTACTDNVSNDPSALAAALSGASNNDVICLASGSAGWTTGTGQITLTATNVTVRGAGTATMGGGDATVIVDNYAANTPLIDLVLPASGVFRLQYFTIEGGSGSIKDEEGIVRLTGNNSTSQVEIGYTTWDSFTYASGGGQFHLFNGINVIGVVHNSILRLQGNTAPFLYRSGASGNGDEVWAAATGHGTNDFLFFEDIEIHGGEAVFTGSTIPARTWDLNGGGKAVLRYSTLTFSSGGEVHATGHAGNDRSGRASETYGNTYLRHADWVTASARVPRALADCQGGTCLIWGNTFSGNTDTIQYYLNMSTTRSNTATYPQNPTPTGFGYCGPSPAQTGTVSITGNTTVTRTGGTAFDTSWPAGTMIHIADAVCEGSPGQEPPDGPGCAIASVTNGTTLTLDNGGSSVNVTGKTYTTGSAWDGNTNAYGYPCMDQAGRGQGDLITGNHPTKVNNTTGTIAWPNQALEPIRVWMNAGTPATGDGYGNGSSNLIVSDRDFYKQASGIQTTSSSPFNGTTGNGWGAIANRPSTCTTGVAYWSTDEGGNWNTANGTANDGKMYVCTSTNTWSARYGDNTSGTPYTYPHPLRQ